MNKSLNNRINSRNRPGIVLLVTLVLLVVLSMLGYTLSTRVAAQRHRNQYIIDYSKARYGCDSAIKYALATLEEINPQLISRPNEPDFSDLFCLTEAEYSELLEQWRLEFEDAGLEGRDSVNDMTDIDSVYKTGDVNDVNFISSDEFGITGYDGLASLTISGPYGPPWPFITEPVEFEIGSAKVRIEIQDENAKYPLGWALLEEKEIQRAAEAGFETFCEMSGLDAERIGSLKDELNEIAKIKPFALDFKPKTRMIKTPVATKTASSKSRTTRTPQVRYSRKTIPVAEQISEQTTHFAKVFHSSLIDTEALARPTITGSGRNESALKYMGTWGTMKVNINTAPRHVLEAAFTFGGDQVQITEEIIQRRREEPFQNIQDLKKVLLRYSDSIGKCEQFITTVSRFFTIKVTVVSGVAKASTVIAITKDGKKIRRIAVING